MRGLIVSVGRCPVYEVELFMGAVVPLATDHLVQVHQADP